MQTSIAREISCHGIGLHSGVPVQMRLLPAQSNNGIRFIRTDLENVNPIIPAHIDFVSTTMLGTSLNNGEGAEINTVEHFLAACSGLGIDNLCVEINGPEIPIMDGSSMPFCQLLQKAGFQQLNQPKKYIRILKPVHVQKEQCYASLSPAKDSSLSIDVSIEFKNTIIGYSQKTLSLSPKIFLDELAAARTFTLYQQLQALQEKGLIKGGSLENAILVNGQKIINTSPLRFQDEFVRHKMLDAIGDLALAGYPIIGQFKASKPGHTLNTLLLQTLMETPHAQEFQHEPTPLTTT